MKRQGLIFLSAAYFVLGIVALSAQENYPNRPIKVIVPYVPGGSTDITARIIGDEFQKITGQPFVVLNKPGAFGILAIEEMLNSPPDGYTLMLGNVSTNTITPILYSKKMKSDYKKSVVAVTNLVEVPAFLLATTVIDFPPKTFAEFIAYAKHNPGKVRYGTVGVGSYPHYDMAYLAKLAGELDLAALPNKSGATGVIQDMLRGDVHVAFLNAASTAGQVQSGGLRALALVNSERLPSHPDVPTMKELGYPDVGTVAWNALFAPAATPTPVLRALFQAVTKAMRSPETQEKLKKQNFNVTPSASLDDAKTWLASEMEHWETITSAVKIDIEQ